MPGLGFSNRKSLDSSPEANKGGHKGDTRKAHPTRVCTNYPCNLGQAALHLQTSASSLKPERGPQPHPHSALRCLQPVAPCRMKKPKLNLAHLASRPPTVPLTSDEIQKYSKIQPKGPPAKGRVPKQDRGDLD